MKLMHEVRGPEGAQKRPFRRLAIAGMVLAASAFAGLFGLITVSAVNNENNRKEQATREARLNAQDSLVHARGWGRVAYEEDISAGSARKWCIEHMGSKIPFAHGFFVDKEKVKDSLLRDAIDEYQWRMRVGQDSYVRGHPMAAATRREDSLFVAKGIWETDSASLVDYAKYMRKLGEETPKYNWPPSAILDSFASRSAMMPKARDRKQDSLILTAVINACKLEESKVRNLLKLWSILEDRKTMVAALKGTGVDGDYVKAMTSYKSLLKTFTVDEVRRDDWLRGVFIRQALRRFRAVKEPDGSSWKQDSVAAMSILNSAYAELWDAYVNDPRVVRVTPGNSGGHYEPHVSAPPPAPGPSQPMPSFVGKE